ncbi:MAG: DUF2924 domain-containing protein [Alphaproteobacteria bacterium]
MGDTDAIAGLDALTRAGLGVRFEELFGRPAPKGMSSPPLRRIVAYRLQEISAGGPNRALKQRLKRLAEDLRKGRSVSSPQPAIRIKPGTRLLRDWQGHTHSVTVTEGGFQYRDRTYRSLSVIAREITGTRWSGPAFFGLRDRKRGTPAPISHATPAAGAPDAG